jgi:hypothetical protein
MDSSVRPAGGVRSNRGSGQVREDPLDLRLHGASFCLSLPAGKARAVEVERGEEGARHSLRI